MPVIHLGYGAANYKSCAATFAALRVQAPFIKDTAITTGKTIPGGMVHTSAGTSDRNKGFSLKQVEHPFNTVILLQANRTRNGLRIADGAVFLRLREGAGQVAVYAVVPPSPENTCGDRVMIFQGAADVLTPDECQEYGIQLPRTFVSQRMDPEEVPMCLDVRKLTLGSARPVAQAVETESGIVVRDVQAPMVRRLRLRR